MRNVPRGMRTQAIPTELTKRRGCMGAGAAPPSPGEAASAVARATPGTARRQHQRGRVLLIARLGIGGQPGKPLHPASAGNAHGPKAARISFRTFGMAGLAAY